MRNFFERKSPAFAPEAVQLMDAFDAAWKTKKPCGLRSLSGLSSSSHTVTTTGSRPPIRR